MKDNREHVFVVGSSRSGTTLVTTILWSCPVYAKYQSETHLLYGCKKKYGDLARGKAKEMFLSDWLRSRQFKRSGLTRKECEDLVLNPENTTYVQLLSQFMNLVAAKQGCDRWIDGTPSNALCLEEIAEHFPNARVIHVIRDGRAVALSRAKLGWCGVRTNKFENALCYSAIYWERSVQAVRSIRSLLGERYLEIRYEALVANPAVEINKLSKFLKIPTIVFNPDRNTNTHSQLSKTPLSNYSANSAFGDMPVGISTKAAYRWQEALTPEQVCLIENIVGDTLVQIGYTLSTSCAPSLYNSTKAKLCRFVVQIKQAIKDRLHTSSFVNTPLELDRE